MTEADECWEWAAIALQGIRVEPEPCHDPLCDRGNHYLGPLGGYWHQKPSRFRRIGRRLLQLQEVACVVVAAVLIAGIADLVSSMAP